MRTNNLEKLIQDAVSAYSMQRHFFVKINEITADVCQGLLTEQRIMAQLTYRTKTLKSFKGKVARFAVEKKRRIRSADDALRTVKDLSAIRIMTYRPEDQQRLIEALKEEFKLIPDKVEAKDKGQYRATHLEVTLLKKHVVADIEDEPNPLVEYKTEIQVCTMMAHVWNEIEHDIRYKNSADKLTPAEERMLNALANLALAGDEIISELLDANDRRHGAFNENMQKLEGFAQYLCGHLPGLKADRKLRRVHEIVCSIPLKLDDFRLDCIEPIKADRKAVIKGVQNYNAALDSTLPTTFQLAETTADLLLFQLLKKHARAVVGALPAGRGKGAPNRARRIALNYLAMPASKGIRR